MDYPKVKAPTLVVYGREDVPLVVSGLNDLWNWVDNELTLLVVPVAYSMVEDVKGWLARRGSVSSEAQPVGASGD